jgi:sortase A
MNRRMRTALRAFSTILIVSGALLVADAAATVMWQEPLSALLGRLNQNKAAGELRDLEKGGLTPIELRALQSLPDQRRRIAFLARSLKRRAHEGEGVGRIDIPRVGANFVIVKGTSTADLRKGPGLYPQTPFPGAPGTVAIAGHRTTYLAPFRHIDELKPGDTITVKMPYATFTYRVERTRIVKPTDLGVLKRVGYDRLVLTACHPLYSAAKRIAVFARLARTEPRGELLRQVSAGRARE